MDEASVERIVGLPPGETLMSLVRLAHDIDDDHPGGSFAELHFYMDWLEVAQGPWQAMGTPRNVRAFAETGDDGNHFGFLMDDPTLPTDARPIVRVEPKSDDDTQIISPNLAAFLGLLSMSIAERMSRRMSDDDWFSARQAWTEGDRGRLQRMSRLSLRLLQIPDVDKPDSPSAVTQAVPDQAFEAHFDGAPARAPAGVPEFGEEGRTRQSALLCVDAFRAERIEEAAFLAQLGADDPRFGPRARWVFAHCAWRRGEKGRARDVARALAEAWIPADMPAPPAMHPRISIHRDELIALLETVARGPGHDELVARVAATPDALAVDEDFL